MKISTILKNDACFCKMLKRKDYYQFIFDTI